MNEAARQVRIRDADPGRDLGAIEAVMTRNLPQGAARDRLEWVYRGNPAGPARVWLVVDAESGEPVGTSAAHPRTLIADGKRVRALVLGDFAIDAPFRTLGPALRLLKATLGAVREGGYALSLDFPSSTMRALYRRLGVSELGPMTRWVRPLRPSEYTEKRFGTGPIARAIGRTGDAALRARDRLAKKPAGIDVEPLEGGAGDEFDAFEERGRACRVIGERSAAYLNWRYGGGTLWPHRVLCARRKGRLVGYLVYAVHDGGEVIVRDLATGGDPDAARALMAHLLVLGHGIEARSISIEALAGSPAEESVGSLGFFERGETPGPVIYFGEPGGTESPIPTDSQAWWILGGDRDV